MGPPHLKITIPLRYGYGVDAIQDTVSHAINWDIIQQGGAWYTIPFVVSKKENEFHYIQPEDLEDTDDLIKLQGEANIRNWFLVRPKELQLLEDTVRTKIFG